MAQVADCGMPANDARGQDVGAGDTCLTALVALLERVPVLRYVSGVRLAPAGFQRFLTLCANPIPNVDPGQIWNGRLAMVGFVGILVLELFTGRGLLL